MKTKEKLIKLLLKRGNNIESVNLMIEEHFEYVNKYYRTVGQMANCIICL
jgi:hypothetical protein